MLGFSSGDPDVVYRDGITDAMCSEGEPHVREDKLMAAAMSSRRKV